jgi:hypothetical protein
MTFGDRLRLKVRARLVLAKEKMIEAVRRAGKGSQNAVLGPVDIAQRC